MYLIDPDIAWFMTGERLEERLLTSDGSLVAINIEWDGPPDVEANEGSVQAAVELQFSNGMSTEPWFLINGLTSDDVEVVAAQASGPHGSNEWSTEHRKHVRPREAADEHHTRERAVLDKVLRRHRRDAAKDGNYGNVYGDCI